MNRCSTRNASIQASILRVSSCNIRGSAIVNYTEKSISRKREFCSDKGESEDGNPAVVKDVSFSQNGKLNSGSLSYMDDHDVVESDSSICRGCGASLQTEIASKPGYLDKKVAQKYATVHRDVFNIECQRCHNIRAGNKITSVVLEPDHARKALSAQISKSKGLIVYLVDLLNVNGSTIPAISQVIGKEKRVIVVGTKLDMIPKECNGTGYKQMLEMEDYVRQRCIDHGLKETNIKAVCLLSAKTGYGVERLLSLINKHRDKHMPVYCVGCTNAGKSTLYNAMQNTLTVHKPNIAMPSQSVTHFYPGSTLGFLRQPLTFAKVERARRKLYDAVDEDRGLSTSLELFDRTFFEEVFGSVEGRKVLKKLDTRSGQLSSNSLPATTPARYQLVNADMIQKDGNWIYDTPGVIRPDQILRYLTPKEVKFLQQSQWVVPRTVILSPGLVLCIGGLAQIHYDSIQRRSRNDEQEEKEVLPANRPIYFTAFCPHNVPLHITSADKATAVMETHRTNNILKIPFDHGARGFEMPDFKAHSYTVTGGGWKQSVSDVVLNGVGWIGVTAGRGSTVTLRVLTPDGIGQELCNSPYLRYAVNNRGKRGVKDMGHSNTALYEGTRANHPQLVSQTPSQSNAEEWMLYVEYRLKKQRHMLKEKRKQHLLDAGMNATRESQQKVNGDMADDDMAKIL